MKRRRSSMNLRGSVTQNTAAVRMRAKEATHFTFLIRYGLITASLFIVSLLVIWLWHTGWPQKQGEKLVDMGLHTTQKMQFAVKDIIVEGRKQVSKDALMTALGTASGAPIFSFDMVGAQSRIAKLPWVATVIVERRLPDTIIVRLSERQPIARWQHDGQTVVIDKEGGALPEAQIDQFDSLPLVVGADAAGQAQNLLDILQAYPAIGQHMMAAVRVGERRWDIHLQPRTVAKLPEKDMPRALSRLSDLIADQKILERDIVTIDLREPNKLFLEPRSPNADHGASDITGEGKHL
jgi:cell division protein FtsQ